MPTSKKVAVFGDFGKVRGRARGWRHWLLRTQQILQELREQEGLAKREEGKKNKWGFSADWEKRELEKKRLIKKAWPGGKYKKGG